MTEDIWLSIKPIDFKIVIGIFAEMPPWLKRLHIYITYFNTLCVNV